MVFCIDCGLTNGKLFLFSETGVCLASTRFVTPLSHERIDTFALREELMTAVRTLMHDSPEPPSSITCISVSGHGNGLYALGETDVLPVGYSSMMQESAEVLPDSKEAFPITLQSSWSGQPLAILSWIKKETPDVYASIKTILFCKDLIRWFMTGTAVTEQTDASAAGLLNAKTLQYDPALLKLYGLEDAKEKFPPVLKSDAIAGRVSQAFSEQTGLPAGIPVLSGLFDVNSSMLGAGILDGSRYAMVAGTWGINAIPVSQPVGIPSITQCCSYFGKEPCVCIDSAPTSCANLEWYVQKLLGESDYGEVNRLVMTAEKSDGLFFLPYLYPPMDAPQAQGGFWGLQPHHGTADLLRAVYEGIVFEHRRRLEKLQAAGLSADGIVLSGGAANSDVFGQMFADVCGLPVSIPAQTQTGALGGAILCLYATGRYASLTEAIERMVSYKKTFVPNPSSYYAAKYEAFLQLFRKIAG